MGKALKRKGISLKIVTTNLDTENGMGDTAFVLFLINRVTEFNLDSKVNFSEVISGGLKRQLYADENSFCLFWSLKTLEMYL